jgi:glycine/D-amino acid oxidase-like deaminating enzyme/nitrite reductase/ring-hydroxylating ferredoxin subunit
MKNTKAADSKGTISKPARPGVSPRDGDLQSPWLNESPVSLNSANVTTETYDALIVGAGITGITAALLLQKAGRKCLVVDAHTVGFGTTGGTSAHINTFADTTYAEAESAFGEEGAQLFKDAINEGKSIIEENIKTYKIDCDFEPKKGYVFAENDDEVKELNELYEGTKKAGVDISYTEGVPTPLTFKKAVVLEGQAQFHPIKYVTALAKEFIKAKGVILENTKIEGLEHVEEIHMAKAGPLVIRARKVIYATHIPPGLTSLNFRCAPYRSYVLGVKLKGNNYPDALIYDMQEPYHYYRTHNIDGQQLLIAGGNDHKTGHDDPEKAFDDLEKYIRKHYQVSSVKYRWSSQYYIPVDGFPYIGQMPDASEGVYCATGFNGNGMMLGTISGKTLSDLVLNNGSKYEKIFSPSRLKPVAGFSEFVKENADVAYHFVADRLSIKDTDSLKRIAPGSGKVVDVDGKKVAAYRDDEGNFHTLNPVCTHAKCIVNWNPEEKSWDCPCHGARYDINGRVLTGPAIVDLQHIELAPATE